MRNGLRRYTVAGVLLHENSGVPLVTLRSSYDGTYLYLQAGPSEAGAILLELKHAYLPYPTAHDLLASLFFRHRFRGKKLVISGLAEKLPTARLEYRRGLKTYTEELRPADGIALALRLGLPIYLTGEAIEQGMRREQPSRQPAEREKETEEPYLYIGQLNPA
jgi:bifunctional DNase/RNase